jgi:hypothetical protein
MGRIRQTTKSRYRKSKTTVDKNGRRHFVK